jgi:hypothetical protein
MVDQRRFDPYAVLGVPRDASPLQVARAHRRLAKRYHPDLHPETEAAIAADRMREVNAAWRILSAPSRRAEYDLAHPSAGVPGGAHWAATRRSYPSAQPNTTATWASWRATAAETRAAPRTRRPPDEPRVSAVRRPEPLTDRPRSMRDSGWPAVLVAAVFVLLLLLAAAVGQIGRPPMPF